MNVDRPHRAADDGTSFLPDKGYRRGQADAPEPTM
jgi:hypothetical protein